MAASGMAVEKNMVRLWGGFQDEDKREDRAGKATELHVNRQLSELSGTRYKSRKCYF